MRPAMQRYAVLSFVFAASACGGPGRSPARGPAPVSAPSGAATRAAAPATSGTLPVNPAGPGADTLSATEWRGEEARYRGLADRLRRTLIDASTFVQFDSEACAQGELRTFPDTSKSGRTTVQLAIERLELLIVSRGIDGSIDAPEMHDLLRLVMRWEASTELPRWDVADSASAPEVIPTGLSGQFRNPTTGRCQNFVPFDTMTFVIPQVTHFTPPQLPGIRATIYFGEPGLKAARDAFYALVGSRSTIAEFAYTRIREAVIWQDYAVVAVNRPVEKQGVVENRRGAGGASYLFHRVHGEWRLLVIARTWS